MDMPCSSENRTRTGREGFVYPLDFYKHIARTGLMNKLDEHLFYVASISAKSSRTFSMS